MPVADTFSYTARWDSVGIDCSSCVNFVGPAQWPDELRVSHCSLHGASLAIELDAGGYKRWEWFCSDFADDGSSFKDAVEHLCQVSHTLRSKVLYRLHSVNGLLEEHEISKLPRAAA